MSATLTDFSFRLPKSPAAHGHPKFFGSSARTGILAFRLRLHDGQALENCRQTEDSQSFTEIAPVFRGKTVLAHARPANTAACPV
ncbi:MAG: hypothetical protein ACOX1P_02740 [Thermoguttaceae bacterium]|jgi:hypothetical protein